MITTDYFSAVRSAQERDTLNRKNFMLYDNLWTHSFLLFDISIIVFDLDNVNRTYTYSFNFGIENIKKPSSFIIMYINLTKVSQVMVHLYNLT